MSYIFMEKKSWQKGEIVYGHLQISLESDLMSDGKAFLQSAICTLHSRKKVTE